MDIIGGLVKLPPERDALPLPRWHRAPLGLPDRTVVYLSLVATRQRPVGNLVLSLQNPSDWSRTVLIDGEEQSSPGVIVKALSAVLPFNIASAQTATTASGEQQSISLICEPYGVYSDETPIARIAEALRKCEFSGLRARPLCQDPPPILWQDVFLVQQGWIRDTYWRQQVESMYRSALEEAELESVVVSADTERQLVRYLFQRKGAFSVQVEHAALPGAMLSIVQVFRELNLNLLTSVLMKGSAKPNNVRLVVVCEPSSESDHEPVRQSARHEALRRRLLESLSELPRELRIRAIILEPATPEIVPGATRTDLPIAQRITNDTAQAMPLDEAEVPQAFPDNFDIAITFAGSERGLAEQLARSLGNAGVAVFCDSFYPEHLWGKDLTVFFDEIFRKRSRYCVMFVSEEYVSRMWTTRERESALARAVAEKGKEYVLPIRVADVDVPGLSPTIGYLAQDVTQWRIWPQFFFANCESNPGPPNSA